MPSTNTFLRSAVILETLRRTAKAVKHADRPTARDEAREQASEWVARLLALMQDAAAPLVAPHVLAAHVHKARGKMDERDAALDAAASVDALVAWALAGTELVDGWVPTDEIAGVLRHWTGVVPPPTALQHVDDARVKFVFELTMLYERAGRGTRVGADDVRSLRGDPRLDALLDALVARSSGAPSGSDQDALYRFACEELETGKSFIELVRSVYAALYDPTLIDEDVRGGASEFARRAALVFAVVAAVWFPPDDAGGQDDESAASEVLVSEHDEADDEPPEPAGTQIRDETPELVRGSERRVVAEPRPLQPLEGPPDLIFTFHHSVTDGLLDPGGGGGGRRQALASDIWRLWRQSKVDRGPHLVQMGEGDFRLQISAMDVGIGKECWLLLKPGIPDLAAFLRQRARLGVFALDGFEGAFRFDVHAGTPWYWSPPAGFWQTPSGPRPRGLLLAPMVESSESAAGTFGWTVFSF